MSELTYLREVLSDLNQFGGKAFCPGANVQQASEIHDKLILGRAALQLAIDELEKAQGASVPSAEEEPANA